MIRISRKSLNFDQTSVFCYAGGIFTSVIFFPMSKINTRAVQANSVPESQGAVPKLQIDRTLKAVRYHSKVCVLALLTSLASPALADNVKTDASIALASTHEKPASLDAEGDIDYSNLSESQIQQRITQVQKNIDDLKTKGGSLSRQQKMELIAYQDELKTLRDHEQNIQKEAIDRKKEAVKANFEEINTALQGKVLQDK